jgi:uncharacterized peroxidase-related enzyme
LFLSNPPASDNAARIYESDEAEMGFVMNCSRLWTWRPDVYEGFSALRAQLMRGSAMSGREFAVLVCATAAALGDSYCALAWGRKLAKLAGPAVAGAVLRKSPDGDLTVRELALQAWAYKMVTRPVATTADDVEHLRAAGLSEQEIFEATTFIAFRHAFSSANNALGARPDWELTGDAPPEVVGAITFGRAVAEPSAHA